MIDDAGNKFIRIGEACCKLHDNSGFFCEKYDFFQGISKKSQEFGLLCIHSYCQHIKELSTVKRIV